MKGRLLLGLAVVFVLVLGTLVVGNVLLAGEDHQCEEAVSAVDVEALEVWPQFHRPEAFPQYVSEVVAQEDRFARSQDFQVARAEALVAPPSDVLPAATVVVTEADQWEPGPGEGTVVAGDDVSGSLTVAMHDGEGEPRWARGQGGVPASREPVGEDYVMVQTGSGQSLSVVALDPESGEVRACTPLGTAEDGEAADTEPVATAQLDDGTMALVQPGGDDRSPNLYRVDPHPVEGDDTGTVAWSRVVEETGRARSIDASGDVIVFGGVAEEAGERWQLVMRSGEAELEDLSEAGTLAVHAAAAETGEPLWSFPAGQVDDGNGTPVPHTLVGATDGAVVVAADRFEEGDDPGAPDDDRLVTTLFGLSPQTGEELWSHDLTFGGGGNLSTVELFGDVVVGLEEDVGQPGQMVALDAVTGDELWRHDPEHVGGIGIDNGTLLGDRLFLPGLSFQGLRVVDIRTGETEILLDGLMVVEAQGTGDGQLGVRVSIGGDEVVARYQLD